MYYQITAFTLSLRDQLRRPRLWAVLLLIPALAFAIRFLSPPMEQTSAARVGVVLSDTGAEDFWSRLSLRSGQTVEFILTDEETLIRNVSVSQWDCGLILDENFTAMLNEGDLERAITLVTGPGSTIYPLVRETTSAVLSEMIAPILAQEYLLSSGIVAQEQLDSLQELVEKEFSEIKRVDVVAQTVDGAPMSELQFAQSAVEQITLGILSVILMVWSLYTAIDLSRLHKSPSMQRMRPLRSAAELLLPRLASMLLPVFLVSALTLMTIFGLHSFYYILALLPYLAALGMLALLLATWENTETILPVFVPFAAAASFVLCPILLDITILFPKLASLSRWMPATLYLQACKGDRSAILLLLCAILILGCAAVVLPESRKKLKSAQ